VDFKERGVAIASGSFLSGRLSCLSAILLPNKAYGRIDTNSYVRLDSSRFIPVCQVSESAGGNYQFYCSLAVFTASFYSYPHIATLYEDVSNLLRHFAGDSCLRYCAVQLF